MCYSCAIAEVVAGLSSQRSRFDPRAVPVGFVVDKWLWDKFF